MIYAKLFPKNLIINDITYKIGSNIDASTSFDKKSKKESFPTTAIHYYSFENMMKFISEGPILGFITIDKGVFIDKNSTDIFKSHKINIIDFVDFKEWISDTNSNDKHTRPATEDDQLKYLKVNEYYIKHIKEPSERIKLEVVKNNGWMLKYIENPSEEVQIAAVSKYGFCIQLIDDPSEKVQLAAVNKCGVSIEFIRNPFLSVQLVAVKKDMNAIFFIKHIASLEVKLESVNSDGNSIQHIDDPCEEVQIAAINNNILSIIFIKNLSESLKLKYENPSIKTL